VGQLRIVDTPLSFPSPYNPSSGSPVTLQYSLSQDADLNIFIFGSSGQIVKKLSALKGSEGGKAGQNKLTWDGRTDFGTIISNGIYVGTIVDKDSQQLLGKVKLVIY
jgi:flagellar hook assembly protein FlgD